MGKQKEKLILEVRLKREVDDDPDLSYLGKYTNKPGDEAHTVDREERGDRQTDEFRYFVAAMSGEETGNPASVEQDYQRCEAYNRSDWCMVGLWAEAKVQLTEHGVIQTVRSGGLWGIESDSDEEFFKEVEREQLAELEEELSAIGFEAEEIEAALTDAKRKES